MELSQRSQFGGPTVLAIMVFDGCQSYFNRLITGTFSKQGLEKLLLSARHEWNDCSIKSELRTNDGH